MIISYRQNKRGQVERRIVHNRNSPRFRGEAPPDPAHFSQRLLNAYYRLECEQGSRFKSSYTKDRIKRTHDDAIARHEAGLT